MTVLLSKCLNFIILSDIFISDIKHKNIMVTRDKKIKLIDFGLSNFLSGDKLGETFCGTPAYAAPEMVNHS